jgi:hypothetical protein
MKKKSTFKRMASALLLVTLMATSVFAATATTENVKPAPEETSNMLVSGTVVSVVVGAEYNTVEITNDTGGMVFHMKKTVFVVDQGASKLLSLDAIKKGMKITVVLDKMAPMTMSLPGQTSGAVGVVITSEMGSIDLSIYNGDLVNLDNTVKLNIHSTTQIVHEKGLKMIFGAEDLKGAECLVLYSVATFSIPAQTTPEFVVILAGSDDGVEDYINIEITDEAAKATYVPLRALAEAKGYEVKWQSHAKPILLSKDDIKIELLIGKTSFVFTHMTKDIKPLDRMSKLDLVVMLESGITMVPSTFIEAL